MNKEGLSAGDGGDLGQGTTRALLGSRKRFPNGSSAYFGRGPRIAYRTTKPGNVLDTHLTTEGVFEPVLVAEICEAHPFKGFRARWRGSGVWFSPVIARKVKIEPGKLKPAPNSSVISLGYRVLPGFSKLNLTGS